MLTSSELKHLEEFGIIVQAKYILRTGTVYISHILHIVGCM
jgi:hypothetical protein